MKKKKLDIKEEKFYFFKFIIHFLKYVKYPKSWNYLNTT